MTPTERTKRTGEWGPLPGTGERLIFLVGCPRSGTTWLQRLLAAHPRIQTGQESNIFQEYLAPQFAHFYNGIQSARGGVGMGCYLTEDEFLAVQHRYMSLLMEPMLAHLGSDQYFLEKTPQHALNLAEIARLLPQARIIHLLRDPRDVVASMLAASKGWGSGWAPGDAGVGALEWVRHVRAARTGPDLFGAGQYLEMRYEELLASPAEQLASCLKFLGLDWSAQELAAAVETNRAGGKQRGEGTAIALKGEAGKQNSVVQEPTGFVRKARAGGWREELSQRDQFRVWRLIHQDMPEFGYHWSPEEERRFGRTNALRRVLRARRSKG